MKKLAIALLIASSFSLPALADDWNNSAGTTGDRQHTTYSTGSQGVMAGPTRTTVPQFLRRPGVMGNMDVAPLPTTLIGTGGARLSPMPVGGGGRFGLPPTNMDSFVFEAGGDAEHIYGDEGVYDIPPYFEFTKPHRIETGIHGVRRRGLTTLHGSLMPDAWGGDEWVDGPEFTFSGQAGNQGGNPGNQGYNPRNNPTQLPNLGPNGGSQSIPGVTPGTPGAPQPRGPVNPSQRQGQQPSSPFSAIPRVLGPLFGF